MKEKDVLSYKDFLIKEIGTWDDSFSFSNKYMALYGQYLVQCSYELNNIKGKVIQLTEEDIRKASEGN